jgi:hypothetical protein
MSDYPDIDIDDIANIDDEKVSIGDNDHLEAFLASQPHHSSSVDNRLAYNKVTSSSQQPNDHNLSNDNRVSKRVKRDHVYEPATVPGTTTSNNIIQPALPSHCFDPLYYHPLDPDVLHKDITNWCKNDKIRALAKSKREDDQLEMKHELETFWNDTIMPILNKTWAVVLHQDHKPSVLVYINKLDGGKTTLSYDVKSQLSFIDTYYNLHTQMWKSTTTKSGSCYEMKPVNIAKRWLRHRNRKQYNEIVFHPRTIISGNDFNLWQGFRINQQMAKNYVQQHPTSSCQLVLNHIKTIWCRGDETCYQYVINWFASILQQPYKKLGTAIVLRGEQGTGKGIMMSHFMASIIGEAHYKPAKVEDLLGRFNGQILRTASLVFADEVSNVSKQMSNDLKTLITEPTHRLEDKFKSLQVSVASYVNFFFASNKQSVISIDGQDRRHLCLETDNRFSGSVSSMSKEYFTPLWNTHPEVFAHYLYELDISNFNAREIPNTDTLREQKIMSMTNGQVVTWWLSCLNAGELPGLPPPPFNDYNKDRWEQARIKKEIYQSYHSYCGSNYAERDNVFWPMLKKLVPYTHKQQTIAPNERKMVCSFPSLMECKRLFRVQYKDDNWKFDSDEV